MYVKRFMNVTIIIGIFLLIFGIRGGYKTGFVKGIANLIALIATLLTLSLILMLTTSFRQGETKNVIYTLIIMAVAGGVYSGVRFALRSMKNMSKLPIISFIDSVLGVVIGIAWVLLLYMAFIAIAYKGYMGDFSDILIADISSNRILTILCKYNIFL